MTTRNGNNIVPFFVLNISNDKVKVLFLVSSYAAETTVKYPILCRGASFDLAIDGVGGSCGTSFLSTEFSSPNPEETARAIAERIAVRQESPPPDVSHLFS